MSLTKVFAADLGTVIDLTALKGAGGGRRFYVGSHLGHEYESYVRFALDWTGVGSIVSAVLTLTTDNGLGVLPLFPPTLSTPKITVRRGNHAFTEGTNSAAFVAADYQNPLPTGTDAVVASAAADALGQTNIDITAIVKAWAPVAIPGGGNKLNLGICLTTPGTVATANFAAFISEDAEAGPPDVTSFKPYITLTYGQGLTAPNAPTSMTPSGGVSSFTAFAGSFTTTKTGNKLARSNVEVYPASATNSGQTVTGTAVYSGTQSESATAIAAATFNHVPTKWLPVSPTTYKWRARVYDNEGSVSLWTDLQSFDVTNTAPGAPTLSPVDGSTYASLDSLWFRGGTFSDADGDKLLAYQIQMAPYGSGDGRWDTGDGIVWDTGKRFTSSGATSWQAVYGGAALTAGTYYWRARQWDNREGVSAWTYASIVLTSDFKLSTFDSTNAQQQRPKVPWRLVIKAMAGDGKRGPGAVVAIIEDAMNAGASKMWNSPGEAHWTLGLKHPQLSNIEAKLTHYSIQFRQGDGWREAYAGLVWDWDTNNKDIIFYGIDYLGLLDYCVDQHYVPANPETDYLKGGSKYSNVAIGAIVWSQLDRAILTANSPVGFIAHGQTSVALAAAMTEQVTVYSTYEPTLQFITGLIDSHRGGTINVNGLAKRSMLSVEQQSDGTYAIEYTDDPGAKRDNIKLRYAELVNAFRVVPFGTKWGTSVAAIGRDKDGVKVRYQAVTAPGIDESVWGHFVKPQFFDGIADDNDLGRRARQAALTNSKLGSQLGIGLRTAFLAPFDGFQLCDQFYVDIEYGALNTTNFGSGYWCAVGVTWTAPQSGAFNTTLTLLPREDSTSPASSLLDNFPISTQAEWQIGWTPPVAAASAKYWLDQNTGIPYKRTAGATLVSGSVTGDV